MSDKAERPGADVRLHSPPADPFVGGSDMAARMRAFEWSRSPLGPPAAWPATLRSSLNLMLASEFPMFIAWGNELTFLYNDAYRVVLGAKHPDAVGRPFEAIWSAIWFDIAPLIDRAMAGEAIWQEDLPLRMNRHGFDEDTTFTFSYSPARDDAGEVAGMFCACTETTRQTRAEAGLRDLAADLEEKVRERSAALLLYENIVPSHRSPVCAFDTDFRLIAFNTAHSDEFYRFFGYRVQVGEVFPDLFPPDQRETMRGFMARALTGESYTVVEEFGDPNLAKAYWEVSYYPLRNEAGQVIGAFHHANDISARLRTESELHAAQDDPGLIVIGETPPRLRQPRARNLNDPRSHRCRTDACHSAAPVACRSHHAQGGSDRTLTHERWPIGFEFCPDVRHARRLSGCALASGNMTARSGVRRKCRSYREYDRVAGAGGGIMGASGIVAGSAGAARRDEAEPCRVMTWWSRWPRRRAAVRGAVDSR